MSELRKILNIGLPLILIVYTVTCAEFAYAQSEPCSLQGMLNGFRVAVAADNVQEWALNYEVNTCPESVSQSALVLGAGWLTVANSLPEVEEAGTCIPSAVLDSFHAAVLSDALAEWEQAYRKGICDTLDSEGIILMATGIRAYYGERVDTILPQAIQLLSSDGSRLLTGYLVIAYGQIVDGELQDADGDTWTFYGTERDRISITLISDDFDPYLELFDPDEMSVATDDDSAGNLDSHITLTLEETGTFTINARAFGSSSEGAYTLSLEVAASNVIAYGETVEAELFPGGNLYSFDAQAGEFITILMTSEDFDTYLELYDPSGDMLATDDDSAGDLDSLITFTIQSDGRFVIMARALSISGNGDFEISVTWATDTMIEYGQTVEAELQIASGDRYAFTAVDGNTVRISLVSEDFDTFLELFNIQGELLASDDDSGGNLDSLIEYEIEDAGTYIIVARSFSSGIGSYSLSLEQ